MKLVKYKLIIMILFPLMLFCLTIVDAKKSNNHLPLFGKVITIDAGHGGRDPGTRYGKILEKDLNLEISKQLERELIKQGAIVYMIRDKDISLNSKYDVKKKRSDLYRRIRFIENKKSDLYLSIHLNWYNDYYYHGVEVLYNQINKENKRLAKKITDSFDRNNIKTRNIKPTDLYLYRNTRIPGVLIECGFLSNKNDRYLLQQPYYQRRISRVITNAVINYLNS